MLPPVAVSLVCDEPDTYADSSFGTASIVPYMAEEEDRTLKLSSGTTSGHGRYVISLWGAISSWEPFA